MGITFVNRYDAGDTGDAGSVPGLGRSPGERNDNPTLVSLPGKSHETEEPGSHSPKALQKVVTKYMIPISNGKDQE